MNYHNSVPDQSVMYSSAPSPPPGPTTSGYYLKVLVPAIAAGAIIGKGGETIAQLQKETGARVKMSKANDFYPGTSERVCLISGSVDGIVRIHDFIMEKIKEKPDPNAKVAIDFDHKQPAERDKQVKVLVPNSTAGMIIGKGGTYIKTIKEESGAYVQISQKSRDHALAERCITVIGESDCNKKAVNLIIQKIVEDPQSGSCLNVSYAEVTGPVANFNPTGSPFASTQGGTSSGPSNPSNSNPSYNGSNPGSMDSLSPTLTGFNSPQTNSGPPGAGPMMQFGVGNSLPSSNSAQMIESIKTMLRVGGYTEEAVSEIASAMNTLANYGMLGLGLGLGGVFNTPPAMMSMGPSGPNNCHNSLAGTNANMYQDPSVQNMSSTGSFGPVGSSNLMSMYGSDRHNRGQGPLMNTSDSGVFDQMRPNGRSSPLPSPGTAPSNHSYNNNSFGLGIMSPGRKSPSTGVGPMTVDGVEQLKVEVEIGDNIVGAILGHGGKSLVEIQKISGAQIQISKKGIFVPGTRNRIVTITGAQENVRTAEYLIQQGINEEENKRSRQQNTSGLSSVLR